jgi:hypothetical protein
MYLIDIGLLPMIPIEIQYKPDTMFFAEDGMHIMNLADQGLCVKVTLDNGSPIDDVSDEVKERILGILN